MINEKQKIIFLLDEGFGLSASWSGNAFQTAKANNIDRIWHNANKRFALKNISWQNPNINPEVFHKTIATGKRIDPNNVILAEALQDGLKDNKNFNKIIGHCIKHKSQLHVISIISDDDRYGSIVDLMNLIKIGKQKGASNILIHLFLDGKKDKIKNKLEFVEKNIEEDSAIEVASISGIDFLLENSAMDIEKVINSLMGIRGESVLSATQAISLCHSATCSKIKPSVIKKNGRPAGSLSDFDAIVSSNFNNIPLALLLSVLKNGYKKIRVPRFLEVFIFFSSNPLSEKEFLKAFDSEKGESFVWSLHKNKIKQLFVSDLSRINFIDNYLTGGGEQVENIDRIYLTKDHSSIESILRKSLIGIKNHYDFIFVDIPQIFQHSSVGDIKNAVKEIRKFDELIMDYIDGVIPTGYKIIITSNVGSAEKISSSHRQLNITQNPLPFIYIDGTFKNCEGPIANHFIYDILKKRYSIEDIHSTILKLYGIETENKSIF